MNFTGKRGSHLLGALLFLFVSNHASVKATPKMEIAEPEFDWGVCAQNVNLHHTFWIKSVGDESLEITHVIPGCGCTKAPIEDSLLAPGDSTRLQITLNTRNFMGTTVKTPKITTNAPDKTKELRLVLLPTIEKSETLRPVSISALKMDVSQFTSKPRRKAKFTLYNDGERDFTLRVVEIGCEFYDVELPAIIPARDSVTGMVVVKESAIESEFDCSFTIEAGKELGQRFSVSVERVVRIKD